jgi:glycerol-3-phosphate acyltransferase PlsY
MAMVGLAAFLGHLFPVFFRFAGGKGVATALGVLVAVSWVLGLAIAVTWALVASVFRYSSLASLVAAVLAPLFYLVGDGAAWYMDKWILLSTTVMSVLLIWRHAENMTRLLKGKESRLGAKKS